MKRIFFIAMLLTATIAAFAQEPEKGDIGVVVMSKFTEEEEAMRFVVRELMFPKNMIPETYDKDLGYIVTERFFYQGVYNAQLVFIFKASSEGVAVKILGRDYSANRNEGLHTGPVKYTKAMEGSPVKSYWNCITYFAENIPHRSLEYFQ